MEHRAKPRDELAYINSSSAGGVRDKMPSQPKDIPFQTLFFCLLECVGATHHEIHHSPQQNRTQHDASHRLGQSDIGGIPLNIVDLNIFNTVEGFGPNFSARGV